MVVSEMKKMAPWVNICSLAVKLEKIRHFYAYDIQTVLYQQKILLVTSC